MSQAPLLIMVLIIIILTLLKFILTNFAVSKQNQIWKIQDNLHDLKKRGSSGEIPKLDEIEKSTSKATKEIGFYIKAIRVLLSGWIAAGVTLLFGVVWVVLEIVIQVISEAVLNTKCIIGDPKGSIIMNYMQGGSIAMFALVFILSFAVLIIDIVLDLVHKKGCNFLGFFKDDKLFFRIEFILIIIPLFIAFLATSIGYYLKVQNQWVVKTIFCIFEVLLWYGFGGNILLITLVKWLMERKKVIDPTSIMEVLGDKKGKNMLTSYAEKEWSQENILLYNDIQKYKDLKLKNQKKRASEIYKTYIVSNAPIEINLPHDIQHKIKDLISSLKDDDEQWAKVFEEAEFEVLKNIKDTFLRFTNTSEFKEWSGSFKK